MNARKNLVSLLFILFGLFSLPPMQQTAEAQAWVKDMFPVSTHDFGTVPRGAKTEYEFKLKNIYREAVHIASVRSSCGCTTPRIKKADLKTYEEGAIVCEFNTQSFIGPKAAVVTVVFTKPFNGEMQLNVRGNIRSDIVTEPGLIEFGEVEGGEEKTTQVEVYYTGQKPWKINDVRSANQNLGVRLEAASKNGRVGYLMTVKLKNDAPAGDFSDQIVLVTNDPEYNLVTIPVSGTIMPPLRLPASIVLGSLKVDQKLSSKVFVSGREPFEITKVECDDPRFTFSIPKGKKKAHIIPIEFQSGGSAGAFRHTITVSTTLAEGGTSSTIVSGNVVE